MAARNIPGDLTNPVFWVDGLVWGFTAGLLVGSSTQSVSRPHPSPPTGAFALTPHPPRS